jgi:glycosyltransferase involved in cell wall biosynthesis
MTVMAGGPTRQPATVKVSVLVITYNHERFIDQALDGVFKQDTECGYEVVIGEDCSTDQTRARIYPYEERYPSVIRTVARATNVGARANLAQTLAACRGEYVALLDGDDYWTCADKLQKQVTFLDQHTECAMCFHNVTVFREDGSRPPRQHNRPEQKRMSSLEDLLTSGNFIATCSAMFRRGLFGGMPEWFYDVPYHDWTRHVLNAQHGTIGYLDEVMGAYRIHSGGMWNGATGLLRLANTIRCYEVFNANLGYTYDRTITRIVDGLKKREAVARARDGKVRVFE